MPIYDYSCKSCGSTYDIFHKVREIPGDIVCPSCGSQEHTRLISAPVVHTQSHVDTTPSSSPGCSDDSCCGGACGLT